MNAKKIKILVNGYGVIGKRLADAVALQDDMELIGVADVSADWRIKVAIKNGYNVFASSPDALSQMKEAGIAVQGEMQEALKNIDLVIDATPQGIGAKNKPLYDKVGVKSIFQGGEEHQLTGFSFVAQVNYQDGLNKNSARCVSCNTTGLARIINTLHSKGLVKKVRASLFRRGTDPWESHKNGLLNTAVPEPKIPSHHAIDLNSVMPDLNIITVAAAGPFNLSHLHIAFVELNEAIDKKTVIKMYQEAPRVVLIKNSDGLVGLNSVIELMRDLGRKRNDMYEVALWEDILNVQEEELFLVYQVHNEAVVIPENIDAARAISGMETDAHASIAKTDKSLAITGSWL